MIVCERSAVCPLEQEGKGRVVAASRSRAVIAMGPSFFLMTVLLTYCSTGAMAAEAVTTAGDIGQVVLPATALGVACYYADFPGLKQFAYAGLTTMATVQTLKHTIHRTRPNGHEQSFPSGHTAAAFWGAGFLHMRYGLAYGVPAYLLASFTGYSRLWSHNHWASDVVAGAALGVGANVLFTSPCSTNVSVAPYSNVERKESGIVMTARL